MKRLFKRKRRVEAAKAVPPGPPTQEPPLYEAISGGAMGCLFCTVLREMFTFDWQTDRVRFDRLWREGFCTAAIPGVEQAHVETDGDYSAFRQVNPVNDPGPQGVTTLWFRNSDMIVIGSNSGSADVSVET